ncbi:hypothetical protein LP415_09280 [Polaromonas sp. P1(28)-8]|nr:hypothetical protein LP415_09280 [Polaromonas sp. P1(28)-8]
MHKFEPQRLLALVDGLRIVQPKAQAVPGSVYLDELTWTEVRDTLRAGATTIIIPVGGT